MFSLPSDMLQVSWVIYLDWSRFHVYFGFEILSFLPSTCIFLWAKKSCFIPYLRIKLYFSHWLSTKAKVQLRFCYRYWFVFPFNKVVFRNPLGRKEKVDEFWEWVNTCQDITTIEVGIWGQAFKSGPCLLTLQLETEHGIPTGHRMPVHLQKSVVLWDMRQHTLGDPAKGIRVRPRDPGLLPFSHFSHTADHISLGQKPDKCVQAILGRRAQTRGCPFHPQILHKVFPAWFPKTSSSGLASGNSSWEYNVLCLGFIKAVGKRHRTNDSSLRDLGKLLL